MISNPLPKLLFVLVLTFFYTIPVPAQNPGKKTAFDSVYYYIATAGAALNIDRAIQQADSLLHHSQDSLQKVRSWMLLATMKKRTGHHVDALKLAMKGEDLAQKINNNDWRIRIAGFLSTTFRELGLIAQGKKYITIAETVNKELGDSPLIRLYIHQEKAYYAKQAGKHQEALSETHAAIALLQKAPSNPNNSIPFATCYQLAGSCYIQLDSLGPAATYLRQALTMLAGQESELKGFIYHNLGELALKQARYTDALPLLDSAAAYARSSDNFNLRTSTFKSLQEYYTAIGEHTKAIDFQSQYTTLLQQHAALTTSVSNQLIENFDTELVKKTFNNYILYIICGVLILVIIAFLIYTNRLRKRERAKYLAYMDRLNKLKRETVTALPMPSVENMSLTEEVFLKGKEQPVKDHESKKGLSIPKETEERLLSGLAEMEAEHVYLENNITLPYIASQLKTNTKYLSAIINKHKEKDFSSYVNEWRIQYIIDKLQQNPQYRQFKIAHLAEECGFSSHSKFTAAFKQVTGISPSAFITNLQKDRRA